MGLSKEQRIFVAIVSFLILVAAMGFFYTMGYASTLSLEAPPPPNLPVNGTEITLTGDELDRDVNIDPMSPLPLPNGTQTISTAGATDLDINEFPPVGITVLIQNETITVTKNQVQIIDPTTSDLIAVDSGDDSSSSDEDEE